MYRLATLVIGLLASQYLALSTAYSATIARPNHPFADSSLTRQNVRPRAAGSWFNRKYLNAPLLYVSDFHNDDIEIFSTDSFYKLVGVISVGLIDPEALAVDRFGTLYVCDSGHNSVLEFARGATTPFRILTSGLTQPSGIAISSTGAIYVSNNIYGSTAIVEFPSGNSSSFVVENTIPYPVGLAFDSADNLFIGAENAGVYEIPEGSVLPVHLNVTTSNFVIGVAVGKYNELYASASSVKTSSADVSEFLPFTLVSSSGISFGTNVLPYYLAVSADDSLIVPLAERGEVDLFRRGQTTPFYAITQGLSQPLGVAFSPGIMICAAAPCHATF